jgi:peptidoglycan/LPS O-acetylase OafA/YrhL
MTTSLQYKTDVMAPQHLADLNRIWFIQLLRAVAVLLVVSGHVLLNFWCANQLYCNTLRITPLKNLVVPDYLVKIFLLLQSWHIHPELIGVGVFFLVSGFVIPISVERYGPLRFIVLRIFRLFPTCAVALTIVGSISLLYAFLAHTRFPYSPRELISSLFLYDYGLAKGFVDPVVWTLRVEVEFYLIVAFIAAVSSLRSLNALLCVTLTMCIAGSQTLLGWGWLSWLSVVIVGSVGSLVFMFIGTAFYNYYKRHWDLPKFLAVTLILYSLFLAVVTLNHTIALIEPYTWGLSLFTLGFACRDILRRNRVLDWFAEISYPLYLLHCVSGTILIAMLFALVPNPLFCTLLSFTGMFIVCQILHVRVEIPGIKLGKSLIAHWKSKDDVSQHLSTDKHSVLLSVPDARRKSNIFFSPGLIAILLFLAVNLCLQWSGQAQLLSFIEKKGRHMPEKVQLYLQQAKAPDVLLMGSSRGVFGLNPWIIETVLQKHGFSIESLNLSIAASTLDLNYLILKNFVLERKKPKVIVYALSEFDILGLRPPDNHYRSLLILPYANLLSHVDDWRWFAKKGGISRFNFITEQLFPLYKDRLLIKDSLAFKLPQFRGFIPHRTGYTDAKGFVGSLFRASQKDINYNDIYYRLIEPNYDTNRPFFDDLNRFVSLARKNGIEIVLVNMPVSNQFLSYWNDDNKIGRYCKLVDEYARTNHIDLLNVYRGISKYSKPEVEFVDSDHLCLTGSERLSRLIAIRYLIPLFDNSSKVSLTLNEALGL